MIKMSTTYVDPVTRLLVIYFKGITANDARQIAEPRPEEFYAYAKVKAKPHLPLDHMVRLYIDSSIIANHKPCTGKEALTFLIA